MSNFHLSGLGESLVFYVGNLKKDNPVDLGGRLPSNI